MNTKHDVVDSDELEAFADFVVSKLIEANAERARVGEREVRFAGLGEVSEDFERVADVRDEEERRVRF